MPVSGAMAIGGKMQSKNVVINRSVRSVARCVSSATRTD